SMHTLSLHDALPLSYFDVDDPDSVEGLIQSNTKLIYVDSPTNPGVDVLDLGALGRIAKKHGLIFIVDNCCATLYLQRPIAFGAEDRKSTRLNSSHVK